MKDRTRAYWLHYCSQQGASIAASRRIVAECEASGSYALIDVKLKAERQLTIAASKNNTPLKGTP